jgi:hypothetical protein
MTIIIGFSFREVPVKGKGQQGLPGGLHRLRPRNEKTTGAPDRACPWFLLFYRQFIVNRLHPGQASQKSCQTKRKNLQTTKLDISYRCHLHDMLRCFLVTKSTAESKQRIAHCFFLDMPRAFRYKTFSLPR